MLIEETFNGYIFSTDKFRLDLELTYNYLANESYWAKGIPYETFLHSVENSVCFGIYDAGGEQAGFGRVVTDKATFGFLGDLFVLEPHRGKRLSIFLMEFILRHPELQGFRRWMLLTRDAQELYKKSGFIVFHAPERCMELWNQDVYTKKDTDN